MQHFWASGYFVLTVGTDEQTVREYIKRWEVEDRRIDLLRIFEEDYLYVVNNQPALSGSHIQSSGFAGGI